MKTIKKVAATPIDERAKVINSFDTTDDKTKNAPSLNAIENYCKLLGDFAVLQKRVIVQPNSHSDEIYAYPDGFNADNCLVIAKGITNVGSSPVWYDGVDVYLRSDEIGINTQIENVTSDTVTFTERIVLMKI